MTHPDILITFVNYKLRFKKPKQEQYLGNVYIWLVYRFKKINKYKKLRGWCCIMSHDF